MSNKTGNKAVTIKDIAHLCGVSAITVSRVLSGSNYPVSGEVRERVLKAAKELKYRPNLLARGLKTNQGLEIAIVIPSLTNPFYTSIVSGVERVAARSGYGITLYNCNNRYLSETAMIENIIKRRIDRLVLSVADNSAALIKQIASNGIKVVLLDCQAPDAQCNQIYFNYYKGSMLETEYLIANGHRRIAYLSLKPDRQSRIDRLDGFKAALLKSGLNFTAAMVFTADEQTELAEHSEFKAGFGLARQALASPLNPTAMVAANDMMALGVLSYLNSVALRVPEAISVVGFDDSIFSELSHPAITTVRVPAEQMGQMAAKLLLDDAPANAGSNFNIVLEPELVERHSVARLGEE